MTHHKILQALYLLDDDHSDPYYHPIISSINVLNAYYSNGKYNNINCTYVRCVMQYDIC